MMYEFNGKVINIPNDELEANMRLGVSKEEAIEIWLEDNEYEINDEQAALDEKAKDYKLKLGALAVNEPKVSSRERAKKTDPPKISIIANLANFLAENVEISNVKIENESKIITFSMNGDNYKLDLTRTRPKK